MESLFDNEQIEKITTSNTKKRVIRKKLLLEFNPKADYVVNYPLMGIKSIASAGKAHLVPCGVNSYGKYEYMSCGIPNEETLSTYLNKETIKALQEKCAYPTSMYNPNPQIFTSQVITNLGKEVSRVLYNYNKAHKTSEDSLPRSYWRYLVPCLEFPRKKTLYDPRFFLFEADNISLTEQEQLIRKVLADKRIGSSIYDIVFSGNKSYHIHLLVRRYTTRNTKYVLTNTEIAEDTLPLYHNLINETFFGNNMDKANKDTSRLTRAPGGINKKTGNKQRVVYFNRDAVPFDLSTIPLYPSKYSNTPTKVLVSQLDEESSIQDCMDRVKELALRSSTFSKLESMIRNNNYPSGENYFKILMTLINMQFPYSFVCKVHAVFRGLHESNITKDINYYYEWHKSNNSESGRYSKG